jgi:hypothetical protein
MPNDGVIDRTTKLSQWTPRKWIKIVKNLSGVADGEIKLTINKKKK